MKLSLTKLHTGSIIIVYLLVLVLALQYWYFNIENLSDLIGQRKDVLARIVLSVLGIGVFFKFRKFSMWYGGFLFTYWAIGCLVLINIQLANDGIFYHWNWLNLLMLIGIAFSLLSFLSPKVRDLYASQT